MGEVGHDEHYVVAVPHTRVDGNDVVLAPGKENKDRWQRNRTTLITSSYSIYRDSKN